MWNELNFKFKKVETPVFFFSNKNVLKVFYTFVYDRIFYVKFRNIEEMYKNFI